MKMKREDWGYIVASLIIAGAILFAGGFPPKPQKVIKIHCLTTQETK